MLSWNFGAPPAPAPMAGVDPIRPATNAEIPGRSRPRSAVGGILLSTYLISGPECRLGGVIRARRIMSPGTTRLPDCGRAPCNLHPDLSDGLSLFYCSRERAGLSLLCRLDQSAAHFSRTITICLIITILLDLVHGPQSFDLMRRRNDSAMATQLDSRETPHLLKSYFSPSNTTGTRLESFCGPIRARRPHPSLDSANQASTEAPPLSNSALLVFSISRVICPQTPSTEQVEWDLGHHWHFVR